MKKEKNDKCPCYNITCPRHGDCEACMKAHHAANSKTACGR